MINVLRNYRFLFITTAIVSFLPIVSVNASSHNLGNLCDPNAQFYKCNDGKKHTIKNKTYHLEYSQQSISDSTPISALYVEKAGTVVDASQITVTGDSADELYGYGALAKEGAHLNLKDSNFKNIPALHAESAVIRMTDGTITGVSHAISALGKGTDIVLVRVKIETTPKETTPKELNGVGETALISSLGSKIRLSGSTVIFNGKGPFSSILGGEYSFDSSVIKGKGKQKTVIVGEKSVNKLPEAFDISQGGFVQLNNSSMELSDMHGFLVKSSSGNVNNEARLLRQGFNLADVFKKTNIKIEKSNISVQGKKAYGLYFYGLDANDIWGNMRNLGTQGVALEKTTVQLSKTNFLVPEGIAIYGTGDAGYGAEATLELSESTKVSGDLLLKAENNSSLSVQAYSSTLTGGARIEDRSRIDLQLRNGSTWYLTKSKYQGSQEADFTVSSLSTLSLLDSTVFFEKYVSQDYQTLYIGNKINNGDDIHALDNSNKTAGVDDVSNKVYSAEGNVQIKMSTFMHNDGSFDPQQTDRILIYGDIGGTTLIGMEKFQKTSDKEIGRKGDQSISLIQVAGRAEESSFKLLNSYTTVNGFPYQYKLRGYGPSSSAGNADPKNRLVAGTRDFWDFRLESVYIGSELDSSESASKPTPTVIPPQSEEDKIPSERPTETISPEQTPTVEPPLIPSTPSLPEETEPSETFIPTDSTPTPSKPIPPELPSVPTVPEEASTEQLMPLVPVETSTDEVMPSKPSVPVVPSATDSDPVASPSDPIEPKPSTSSDALKPSSNLPMPLDVQPELGIRAVVPQLPTYLLLPNALFHAGLMDMTTQNKKLETMRGVFHSSWKEDENTAFFLRAYGGSHHYASNLSAFEYGYGAELDYNAFQAGVLLNEIESLYTRTFFGALGNYGNLSLHPQNVEQSKKSAFHKWSVGAYGSLQHDTGFYMDGVLSYGLFKGDVLTLARGKVVALKGKQFSGSLTSGRTFAIGDKGVVFDPQVQIVYQHLQFHQALDVDNLDVDLGKFHQWMGRVSGRLSKTLGVSEKGREVSFYSKLSYLHSFEDKQFVSFKNDFQLGSFGSSLEAGLGFDARLSSKLSLHGDVTYQHRLKKVGFSGTHFSAGLRYLF
ncbi:autotransporter outer membrane beta-barrel domain-containing protein [Bartonella kosoyi]|uniref:Autotransporter outer membrane beta-barrel domain-containing protein n=2 Tax=Bartonella TaxID=773 RepID=A0A5B9CZP0_9HYPH|nr:autotransporter outer membrane beta-barrel domain-containing protein [Bartonella kosoyi]QEE09647.1 autotransporter outer membrane beta-barrel domain-containing protein [Bartonella kosoyi]